MTCNLIKTRFEHRRSVLGQPGCHESLVPPTSAKNYPKIAFDAIAAGEVHAASSADLDAEILQL